MKGKTPNRIRSIFAHLVLIILSFMCLFFFYILFINATRSHADLQKGFTATMWGSYEGNVFHATAIKIVEVILG